MLRNFTKRVCIGAVLIISFVSMAAGLSLEELRLEMKRDTKELGLKIRQLQHNEIAKDAQLQELQLKVQHLETQLEELRRECQRSSQKAAHHSIVKRAAHSAKTNTSQVFFRTCKEIHQSDPLLSSGMYWIDPSGYGLEDPIHVHCDMKTGKTSIHHDSETPINVGNCEKPGCYSKTIKYSASMRQMKALAALSSECHQSIRYDCTSATFEANGIAQSWWHDRNGVAQYFWSGSNNSVHTCQCGIDKNCAESFFKCNCDSAIYAPLSDAGVITDKKYLPIIKLHFGRTQFETSSGVHTLGRFECTGQASVSGVPMSCSDLWKIGHTLSGIYSVMGSYNVETVYCDFTRLPYEQGFQRWIGYADVKSTPIYFYVQRNSSFSEEGIVPFELTRLNIGGAMNASSGIFTAPRNGIYSFAFSGLGRFPTASNRTYVNLALQLNGNPIGRTYTETNDDSFCTLSLLSTLEMKKGDRVWMRLDLASGNAKLYDDTNHYTHFTGHLLQEKVTS